MRRPVDATASKVIEARLDRRGRSDPVWCRVQTQAGDGAMSTRFLARLGKHREAFFRRSQICSQQLALSPLVLERKDERVAPLPTVLAGSAWPVARYVQRRGVGRRSLGPFAGNEIKLGDPLALLRRIDQAAYRDRAGSRSRRYSPRSPSGAVRDASTRPILRCAAARSSVGDERIGSLLNAVVQERVGALQTEDQSRAGRLPECRVNLLF